jgi:hypothetical protein
LEKTRFLSLYPVRVKDFTEFAAVNYDKWDICDAACSLGQEKYLFINLSKLWLESLVKTGTRS